MPRTTGSSSSSIVAGVPRSTRISFFVRRSPSTAPKRKPPGGWPPRRRLLTCRGTRSTLGPPMPRRGCPSTAPSTGCARSTATNPGTTNCAPKPSITVARPCTPTLRTIQEKGRAAPGPPPPRGKRPPRKAPPPLWCLMSVTTAMRSIDRTLERPSLASLKSAEAVCPVNLSPRTWRRRIFWWLARAAPALARRPRRNPRASRCRRPRCRRRRPKGCDQLDHVARSYVSRTRRKLPLSGSFSRADDGSRTRDLRLGKPTLYQLSYVRAGRSGYQGPRGATCARAPPRRAGRAPDGRSRRWPGRRPA